MTLKATHTQGRMPMKLSVHLLQGSVDTVILKRVQVGDALLGS